MNSNVIAGIFRFLLLAAAQIIIFKQIALTAGSWFHAYVYPIFIFLLPITIPSSLAVFLGFLIGIAVDIFYNSPGVHAGASVFSAWFRNFVLDFMEPRGGYTGNQIPSKYYFGMGWTLQFMAICMGGHLFFYFWMDAFSHVYFLEILKKTVAAFFMSMFFVLIFQQLFDPKN
jgi:hypothetical protein